MTESYLIAEDELLPSDGTCLLATANPGAGAFSAASDLLRSTDSVTEALVALSEAVRLSLRNPAGEALLLELAERYAGYEARRNIGGSHG